MAYYTFIVTGKGMYNAPKGAVVQIVKSSSTLTMTDIKGAFLSQLGINVTGSTSNYDIVKLF